MFNGRFGGVFRGSRVGKNSFTFFIFES